MFSHTISQIETRLLQLILFIVIFLSFLHYASFIGNTLDHSWMAGLGIAYKQNLQYGTELIFTYGPLGYFYNATAPYDMDLFASFIAWQFIAAFVIAALFMLHGQQLRGLINKWIYFYLVLMLSVQSVHLVDSVYYLSVLLVVALIINPPTFVQKNTSAINWFLMLLILSLFATLAMTKFVLFLITGFNIIIISIIIGKRHGWLKCPFIIVAYTALVMGLWTLLGQSVENLPAFIINSLEISRGYNAAMLSIGSNYEILLVITVLGLTMLIGLISAFAPKFNIERLLLACSIGFSTFLIFKAGLVRHDAPHASIFFAFLMLVPFMFDYEEKMKLSIRSLFHSFRYMVILLSVIGLISANQFITVNTMFTQWNQHLVDNTKNLLKLPQLQQHYHNGFAESQRILDLPKVRETVGEKTLDILSFEQVTLFLNQFNWHPRPIFQSYSAYTTRLLNVNGNFYGSKQAPQFVLFKLQTIDGRFPLMDDIEVIKVLMRDYIPVLEEKDYLLLQHAPRGQGRVAEGDILLQHDVKFGESIDISDFSTKPLLLSLEFNKTAIGEVFSFLYKSSLVYMELTTSTGQQLRYRIMPNMMETGLLINPLIISKKQFIKWYKGKPLPPINQVKIIVDNTAGVTLFEENITFKLSEYPILPPSNIAYIH
ncbi:hypothetical protein [Candidatus Albibeggiatoa sp. nov. BB20]|uniref:hypothetical protein n=1 Tax=Candidatus Albibeggiatoa sp. nov. BB20 TaxID=3162723 RepID=UPI0033655CD0